MKARLLRIVAVLLMVGFVTVPSITTKEIEEQITVVDMSYRSVSEMTWSIKGIRLFNNINFNKANSIMYIAENTPVEKIRVYRNGICAVLYNGREYYTYDHDLTANAPSIANYNRWNIELTESEIDMLADIMYLEAHTESDEGMIAAIEIIFNRMVHEKFPNTLEEVLSQSNPIQFTTWKNRHLAKPTEKEYELIYAVLYGETEVLSKDYVFFGRGKQNNNDPILIDNHWFCKR